MVFKWEIFDVAVDIQRGSPRFGKWVGIRISEEDGRQVFIPEGFAHGFCALREGTIVSYMCSDLYHPQAEGGVIWNDPDLGDDACLSFGGTGGTGGGGREAARFRQRDRAGLVEVHS